jgi:hypothetical protein
MSGKLKKIVYKYYYCTLCQHNGAWLGTPLGEQISQSYYYRQSVSQSVSQSHLAFSPYFETRAHIFVL